jgi:hypothetical protein
LEKYLFRIKGDDEHYKDTQTNYFIAVKHMEFQGAKRLGFDLQHV